MKIFVNHQGFVEIEVLERVSFYVEQYLPLLLVSMGVKRGGTLMFQSAERSLKVRGQMNQLFKEHGVCYSQTLEDRFPHWHDFVMAEDMDHLSKLDTAFRQPVLDHLYIGELLDFPRIACEYFARGSDAFSYLRQLRVSGVSIPSWVAFCPFVVPAAEIFQNGECAKLGRKYEQYAQSFDRNFATGLYHNFHQHLTRGKE